MADSLTDAERQDRVKERRARIEQRIMSRDEDGNKNKRDVPEHKQLSRGKQQIADSLVNLDKKKSSTIQHVTSIRVDTDSTENSRRIGEEDRRQSRLHTLQEEAVNSGKQNATVEMKWAELMEYNMPQELMREMKGQQDLCEGIISSKNKLITDFQTELKRKDDEYVKSLKQQNDDVEDLLGRMSRQYMVLQEEYAHELEAIETAFLKEREELLDDNKNEMDSLFDKRRTMETQFMEARQEREDRYQNELQELRAKDAEDYNKLKIKLETDIQTLEQQLEEMRATYQLNTEKLEYNYRVLTERDMENSATLAQQKRKLTRLKDGLSNLIQRYNTTDQKYKAHNMELTDEYRRITKQYKDLQAKFKHFEVADNKRFQEVWNMHEQEVRTLAQRLLQADRVIHQQQLGLSWAATPIPQLYDSDPPAAPQHKQVVVAVSPPSDDLTKTNNADGDTQTITSLEETKITESVAGADGSEDIEGPSTLWGIDQQGASTILRTKLELVLKMMGDETSFLLDPRLHEELQNMPDQSAAANLRAQAILKALGADTGEDLTDLCDLFFEQKRSDEEEELAFAIEKSSSEAEKLQKLGLKIDIDDVVRILTSYMQEKNSAANLETQRERLKRRNLDLKSSQDASRALNRQRELEFWEDMVDVVSPETDRVWSALEKALVKYNSVLTERAEMVEQVSGLKTRNDELRHLLSQYLNASVEQELLVPPSHTIVIGDEKERMDKARHDAEAANFQQRRKGTMEAKVIKGRRL